MRQLVELHGGSVGADSRGVKQGTTFWVTLPAAQHRSTSRRRLEAPAEPVTLKGVAILIVEDETDSRELLVAMLEEYGARVRAVDSADAALGILDGNGDGFVPDVLVSDVGMPGTDGFALVRELRSRRRRRSRKLPAIAVTAYANPEDRVRALVAGYQNHVPKPVDANVLAAAIAKLVAGGRTCAARANPEALPAYSVFRCRPASPAAAAAPAVCLRDPDRRRRSATGCWLSAWQFPAGGPVSLSGVPGAGARAGAFVARVSICSRD